LQEEGKVKVKVKVRVKVKGGERET